MNLDDLIGIKFNMLEVISYSHSKNKGGKQHGNYHYNTCKCECGNDTIATREQIHKTFLKNLSFSS